MFTPKKYFVIGAYCLFAMAFSPNSQLQKWVLVHGSSLKIDGSTNVNHFTCEISNYSEPDTLTVHKNSNHKDQSLPFKGVLTLDVMNFNCHNAMMTKDLRKTLKEKEFPRFHIRFSSISSLPQLKAAQEAITGVVEIELAGVIKQFNVNYQLSLDAHNTIHLVGKRAVTFSDFNLQPPRKLGGMIQAKDKLDVEFHLLMKEIN